MKRFPAWLLALLATLPAWSANPGISPSASAPLVAPTTNALPSADAIKAQFFTGIPAAAKAGDPPKVEKSAPARHSSSTAAKNAVHAMGDRLAPDYSFTPGRLCTASDPDFKEYRYPEHIPYCNRDVTEAMKETVAAHYGVPKSEWSNYEFDHLIPLCIGGDSHVDNLWPQPHGNPDGSNGKDKLEDELYQEMKDGKITQADAIKQIYDWFNN